MSRNIACAGYVRAFLPLLTTLAGSAASAQPAFHDIIAKTGDQIPGAPGVTMDWFWDNVHMSTTGKSVYFAPFLKGVGVNGDNDLACFSGSPDAPAMMFRTGVQAPGCAAGIVLDSMYSATIADSTALTFIGILKGPGITANVNDRAIYAGTPGSFSLVLRDGSAAPTLPGVTITRIGSLEVNPGGKLSFGTLLAGAGIVPDVNDRVFYYGLPGALQVVARNGEQAAGLPAGVKYDWLHNWHEQSDNGKLGFIMNLEGVGVDSTNNQAAYVGTPGNLTMVVRTGTQAPGEAAGVVLSELVFTDGLNNNGYLTMIGRVGGSGVTIANDTVLLATTSTGLKVIARENRQAPGLPAGVLFGSIEWTEGYATIGGANVIMMRAGLKGAGVSVDNDRAVWVGQASNLQLLAREGGQVPGEPAGVVWSGLEYNRISCNNLGQVAFNGTAKVLGTGQDRSGIYLRETNGQIRSIVKTGDTLMVGPGDYRVVETVTMGIDGGGQTGSRTVLTDSGLVIGVVRFTDMTRAVAVFDTARACPADFDSSGFVDTDDFDAFVNAFKAGIGSADFDQSGFVDTDDFDAFVMAFEAGC